MLHQDSVFILVVEKVSDSRTERAHRLDLNILWTLLT